MNEDQVTFEELISIQQALGLAPAITLSIILANIFIIYFGLVWALV